LRAHTDNFTASDDFSDFDAFNASGGVNNTDVISKPGSFVASGAVNNSDCFTASHGRMIDE
jgi:hypothetical protein